MKAANPSQHVIEQPHTHTHTHTHTVQIVVTQIGTHHTSHLYTYVHRHMWATDIFMALLRQNRKGGGGLGAFCTLIEKSRQKLRFIDYLLLVSFESH